VKPAVSFAEAQAELQKERQIHYNQPEHAEQVADSQPDRQIDQSKPDLSISDQSTVDTSNADWSGRMIPIGQVDLTYIIAHDLKGLYIIDQHADHERILFDKLSAMADGIPSQQLLVHQLLTFDRKEAALVEENKELFAKLGFHMEAAGDFDYRLMEVPADVPVGEAEDIIREILTDLGNMHETTAKEIRQACLATTACRAAIKAGEELNMRQMEILLDELSTTAFPYTCPHGRPTILKFSSEDLAKMFKRTGFGF
jgi:DNA mismatch repair protein MutL